MDSEKSQPTVISIGDLVADLVIHIPRLPAEAAHHQLARSMRLEPGGAGNLLIAGARLGMQMRELGVIGDDLFAKAILDTLTQEGVDVTGVVCQPGSTTTSVAVLADDEGQHVFLGTYGEGPEIVFPQAWEESIQNADAVFTSGYSLQESRLSEACLRALVAARERDIPVFFDPGPEMARAAPSVRERVLAISRVILTTEEEIPLLTGGPAGLEAVRELLGGDLKLICVKRGGRGCVLISAAGQVEHPGFAVQVRDTAAAGDSFDAAFIYAWLRMWPPDQIAAFANAMGAAKVQKMGSGSQVPTAAEVQSVLDRFGVGLRVAQAGTGSPGKLSQGT